MKIVGILIVLTILIFTAWRIVKQNERKKGLIPLCLIAVFAGLFLILQDRVTELTVKGIGTIKAATAQVQSDANTVAELKKRVEDQSATVDLVAKEALKAKEISENVADKNRQAEEKLLTLNEALTKANASLAKLDAATEFTMTVLAAQNDDRSAFDNLKKWSVDKNNSFSSKADQAWNTIFESHCTPMYSGGFTIPWENGFDPSKLNLSDLVKLYHNSPVQLKPALLEYIWGRDNISLFDRLDFMINVMLNDNSLTAVEYAGRFFTSGTGQNIKPMAVDYIVNWWKKHKLEYKEK
jgi:hypothetical protein